MTTHDLPTVAGLWSGADLKAQREIGLEPNEEGTLKIAERLSAMTGITDETPVEEVITRTDELLGASAFGDRHGDIGRCFGRGRATQYPGHHRDIVVSGIA